MLRNIISTQITGSETPPPTFALHRPSRRSRTPKSRPQAQINSQQRNAHKQRVQDQPLQPPQCLPQPRQGPRAAIQQGPPPPTPPHCRFRAARDACATTPAAQAHLRPRVCCSMHCGSVRPAPHPTPTQWRRLTATSSGTKGLHCARFGC